MNATGAAGITWQHAPTSPLFHLSTEAALVNPDGTPLGPQTLDDTGQRSTDLTVPNIAMTPQSEAVITWGQTPTAAQGASLDQLKVASLTATGLSASTTLAQAPQTHPPSAIPQASVAQSGPLRVNRRNAIHARVHCTGPAGQRCIGTITLTTQQTNNQTIQILIGQAPLSIPTASNRIVVIHVAPPPRHHHHRKLAALATTLTTDPITQTNQQLIYVEAR